MNHIKLLPKPLAILALCAFFNQGLASNLRAEEETDDTVYQATATATEDSQEEPDVSEYLPNFLDHVMLDWDSGGPCIPKEQGNLLARTIVQKIRDLLGLKSDELLPLQEAVNLQKEMTLQKDGL